MTRVGGGCDAAELPSVGGWGLLTTGPWRPWSPRRRGGIRCRGSTRARRPL